MELSGNRLRSYTHHWSTEAVIDSTYGIINNKAYIQYMRSWATEVVIRPRNEV